MPSTKVLDYRVAKCESLSLIYTQSDPISHTDVIQDVIYDPPTLPAYVALELKPVTGPPSNEEIASVHTALRISESFANGVFVHPQLRANRSRSPLALFSAVDI